MSSDAAPPTAHKISTLSPMKIAAITLAAWRAPCWVATARQYRELGPGINTMVIAPIRYRGEVYDAVHGFWVLATLNCGSGCLKRLFYCILTLGFRVFRLP